MKREKFQLPEVEIILFSIEDVISTSGPTQDSENDNGTPWLPL